MEFNAFVPQNNSFMFDMEMFHQIIGTFMGTTFVLLLPVFDPEKCAFIKNEFVDSWTMELLFYQRTLIKVFS